MINKKEKYLKNYLNYEQFKKSLTLQQNKFIELYKKESINKTKNIPQNIIINPQEIINSSNLLSNIPSNNLNNSYEITNIYKIRLEQAKPTLIELCKNKWPNITISKSILELKGNVKKYLY